VLSVPKQVQEIFKEVMAENGVILECEIVGDHFIPPSYTWGKIILPYKFVNYSRQRIWAIFQHEFGHRTIFPASAAVLAAIYKICRNERITDPHLFVNVIADIIVDRELAHLHQAYLEDLLEGLEEFNPQSAPLRFLKEMYCYILQKDFGIPYQINYKHLKSVQETYMILFLTGYNIYRKIRKLIALLRKIFNQDRFGMNYSYGSCLPQNGSFPNSPFPYQIPSRYSRSKTKEKKDSGKTPRNRKPTEEKGKSPRSYVISPLMLPSEAECLETTENSEIIKEYIIADISPVSVEADCTYNNPQWYTSAGIGGDILLNNNPFFVKYEKIRLYGKYIELSDQLRGSHGDLYYLDNWKIGDPPQILLYEDTLRIYGKCLPPIFSLKYTKTEKMDNGGTRGGNLCLVLDVSGSMTGDPIARVREVAYALIQEARSFNDLVSIIPFSGSINENFVVEPTYDYSKAENLVVRLLGSGGTQIRRAIKKALEFAQQYKSQTTYIITDTGIYDLQESISLLKRLSDYGKTILFIMGSSFKNTAVQEMADKIYILKNVSKPFMEEALLEYYGDKYGR